MSAMPSGGTSQFDNIEIDDIPPVAAPLTSAVLVYSVLEVGFNSLIANLAVGGAGVAIFAGFGFKFVMLKREGGFRKALKWATTAPADR